MSLFLEIINQLFKFYVAVTSCVYIAQSAIAPPPPPRVQICFIHPSSSVLIILKMLLPKLKKIIWPNMGSTQLWVELCSTDDDDMDVTEIYTCIHAYTHTHKQCGHSCYSHTDLHEESNRVMCSNHTYSITQNSKEQNKAAVKRMQRETDSGCTNYKS